MFGRDGVGSDKPIGLEGYAGMVPVKGRVEIEEKETIEEEPTVVAGATWREIAKGESG